jgi:peptide/nickel transport system ATP-binding protein
MSSALSLDHVTVSYRTPWGLVPALRDVSLTLYKDEILGIVGESGSGKSTLAQAIMRLLKPDVAEVSGRVVIGGHNLYDLSPRELREMRWRDIAMVFQSSMNALNPVLSIQAHFTDTLSAHRPMLRPKDIYQKTADLLASVRLNPTIARSYPHELSGGMRQRVVIALALALDPQVLIMDEPTTALDVVVQRSILTEIAALQEQRHVSVVLISHDFSLVSNLAHRIAVMYAGELMEITADGMDRGGVVRHHPYTEGLISAIPQLLGDQVKIAGIPGEPPDMAQLRSGCPFYERCPKRLAECQETPLPSHVGKTYIRCHAMPDGGRRLS